jgi:hypothetical protein
MIRKLPKCYRDQSAQPMQLNEFSANPCCFPNLVPMEYNSEEELLDIVDGFLNRTLEKQRWTHHAHIITAIWHLKKYDKDDALCRLRSGIISYNLSVGGENNGQHGYHETMTVFWWELILQYLEQHPGNSFLDDCAIFLSSPMADKNFPFQFYSREYILSGIARARYQIPDLREIKIEL